MIGVVMGITRVVKVWVILVLCGSVWIPPAFAARVADIANTKHNFSANYPNTLPTGQQREMRAVSEPQICVFGHTPHAAIVAPGAPLWNRQLPQTQYIVYGSNIQGASTSSFDAQISQPNGVSKLCLSCHDGTMAVGAVNVLNGTDNNANIQMTPPDGRMPAGHGTTTGFTRYLGTNLTNDHPISVVYDQNLVAIDGEMRNPQQNHIFTRGVDSGRPATEQIHLEGTNLTNNGGLVQCNSCHDPHIRSTDPTENIKFLRLNRLQSGGDGPSTVAVFSPQSDIICLACHEKVGWAGSAHANRLVANEVYTNEAADAREFPRGTAVWESACLACHDTHTVEGARRLLREGVDGNVISLSGNYRIKAGNARPAIEEACFECHSRDGYTLVGQDRGINNYTFEVPDTKTDFNMARHMPITTNDQSVQPGGKNYEVHDIGTPNPGAGTNGLGKDFIESPTLMGNGNRHAECTDCHNPHRVTKLRYFYQDPVTTQPAPAGTHTHENGTTHNNIASGVLRGIWGVEPVYGGTQFTAPPVDFIVKRGNPANTPIQPGSDPNAVGYLTREYQICFKCHSNYSFGTNPPSTGWNSSLTPGNVNNIGPRYTNVAMEYQSPPSHQGEGSAGTPGGTNWVANNHRAWHPVMRETGRDPATRGNASRDLWLPPFRSVGAQTMYCSDCHGNAINSQGTVVPTGGEDGYPWGPHGSNNYFLLKGAWSGNGPGMEDGTNIPGTGPGRTWHLCFKCHNYDQYATQGGGGTILNSGFGMSAMGCMGGGMGGMGGGMCMMGGGMGGMGGMAFNNLHVFHNNVVSNFRCNLCHIAIPHGWKNKNFLVNLNDIGPEGTNGWTGEVRTPSRGGTGPYFDSPYYNRAALKVVQFTTSGNWNVNSCGSMGRNGGNGQTGVAWMSGGTEACGNLP
ncbi:MAG: hypothetical protein AMJ53_13120 [Gammaproteobacteria bacterium SG8_11]|nr:MAG: hypothetical protein AMJ53_13120 [Gammaproteobacteria bacterium SG8_11]